MDDLAASLRRRKQEALEADGSESPQGDIGLQDALENLLYAEVAKVKIDNFVEDEKNQLIDAADLAKMEIDLAGMEV